MPRQHKALPRLFVAPDLGSMGQSIGLDPGQSNYLLNVLRRRPGDELVLFNGRDGAWLSRIAAAAKKGAVVELAEQIAVQPPSTELWYGFAPLKAARLDYMVQKATEMGATIIQPVITRFTQVRHLKAERLLANAIEAAEQCEVLTVPEIAPEVELANLIARWPSDHRDRVLIVADEATSSASPLEDLRALAGRPIGLFVGPEGGFSDEERQRLLTLSFVRPISLGPRILRADTAAVAALAVIQATIGDWR